VERVYLHVGAPKAGSTFLQNTLWANRPALQAAGVGVPGVGSFEHYRASKDLRGDEFDPREPGGDGTGSWEQFIRKVHHRREPVVVLSDELMCGLSTQQIERAVQSLAPREVHTIYVMRGLQGLLPSYWQEVVKHGGKRSYPRWVRAVLSDRQRPFWQLEDAASVMRRWGAWVAPDCQHVIILPTGSAGQRELWRRFASVVGVEQVAVTFPETSSNRSLGLAETELLRKVNVELADSLERWDRSSLVREVLAAQILGASSEPGVPRLPKDVVDEVESRQAEIVDGLLAVGCHVVGSVDDLPPRHQEERGSPPDDAELLGVAVRGIAGLLNEMAERQEATRHAPTTRVLESVLRRKSLARVLAAVEGRSARVDSFVARHAGEARDRLRGRPSRSDS
jgi:hypothetical protein